MALSLGVLLVLAWAGVFSGAMARCPIPRSSEKYAYHIKSRMRIWKNRTLGTARPWQHLVNNKLTGYMYAMHHGVPTPRVYSCNHGIPNLYPRLWGTNSFVVKPLDGWGSVGIVVSDNGYDKSTSLPLTNKTLLDIYRQRLNQSATNKAQQLMVAPNAEYMVEELLRPMGELHSNSMPADIKFEVYNGKILLILYIERMWDKQSNPSTSCVNYFDGDWNFVHGIVTIGVPECLQERTVHPPKDFEAMKDMVLRMANGLGVYYRIDMFFTSRGPVLGEFTPWTSAGVYHETKTCYIMADWGGDGSRRSTQLARAAQQPDILRGWGELPTTRKCEQVRKAQQHANGDPIQGSQL